MGRPRCPHTGGGDRRCELAAGHPGPHVNGTRSWGVLPRCTDKIGDTRCELPAEHPGRPHKAPNGTEWANGTTPPDDAPKVVPQGPQQHSLPPGM